MQLGGNTIPNNGLIRYRGMFNQERLLITGSKALAEVLVTKNYEFIKPSNIRFFIGRLLGVGVLLAEGEEHKMQRKNLMPAFAFRHVKDLYPVFWKKGRESVQALSAQVLLDAAKQPTTNSEKTGEETTAKNQAALEIGVWASRTTLDVIGLAGLGNDFGAIKDPDNALVKTYTTIFKPSPQAQFLGLLGLFLPDWLVSRLPVQRNSDLHEARRLIRATCRDLIRQKKERLARKERTDVDILSVAIESGGFTDENLVDQLMTFLAAGHETTAAAMTWAVYMLCLHPEIQARLRAEIRERLPSPDDAGAQVTAPDIDRMPYLNAFCAEVLRYYAPVAMTLREAAVDTTIQGQPVPRGTRVMIVPWATNKSEELWGADAGSFDPERWLRDKQAASGGASSNFAYLTFLHGPRSCMGMSFAKAEFAILLAAWAGRLEFALEDESLRDEAKLEIKGGVTARPAKGLRVKVKVLEGW
jgi:cytochrome P450